MAYRYSGYSNIRADVLWILEFAVTTIDGLTVSSVDSYEAAMVIVLFNTGCPDCRRELPEIQKRYEADKKSPEAEHDIYIDIAREEEEEDMIRYWAETHLILLVSAQPDRTIYALFASVGIPSVFHVCNGWILRSARDANL